jgi:hypothetical protein
MVKVANADQAGGGLIYTEVLFATALTYDTRGPLGNKLGCRLSRAQRQMHYLLQGRHVGRIRAE